MDDAEEARALAGLMADGCLGVRVGRLSRLVNRRFEQSLRPLALTVPQLEVLSTLTLVDGPVKPSFLASALAVERSTMSRNLAAMTERGFVAPSSTSAGGRAMTVAITAHGTATLAAAHEAWASAQEALSSLLGPAAPGTLDQWIGGLVAAGL